MSFKLESIAVVSSPDRVVTISLFNNERDNLPVQHELPWEECRKRYFSKSTERSLKGGMAFSPVSYRAGAKRGVAGVDEIFLAVFDIEHHGAFDQVKHLVDGFEYVCHSSYSHTIGHPRYRLILPLAQAVPAADWPAAWSRLNQWLGGINDPSTKDAARLYYLPSNPPGAQGHFLVHEKGRLLDVGELPALVTSASPPIASGAGAMTEADVPEQVAPRPLNPADGLARVVERCKFMAHISMPEQQATASRGLWRAMISNACRFKESEAWIHSASQGHADYTRDQTDAEISGCRSFAGGPQTCAHIREQGFQHCPIDGCRTAAGNVTKAPAGLWIGDGGPLPVGIPGSVYRTPDGSFEVSDEGVFAIRNDEDGEQQLTKICSRVELLAQTVSEDGSWGFEVAILDPDGEQKSWTIKRDLMASNIQFVAELLNKGADVWTGKKQSAWLYDYFLGAKPNARARSVSKTGWNFDGSGVRVFVFPGDTIGPTAEKFFLQASKELKSAFSSRGSLQDWKDNVGTLCVGNSRLILTTCAALVGPLLNLVGEENGGIHLIGASSMGKTTAVEVAASVWGRRDTFVKNWRTTSNGLEAIASGHNDTLLILDEISQVTSHEAGEIAYMLGNGRGKVRANRDASTKDMLTWRLLFLSTGERSLAEHMQAAGRQAMVGQEMRLVNIRADAGAGLGLFEQLHGRQSGQQMSADIKALTLQYFGVAGPAFVEALCGPRRDELLHKVRDAVEDFVSCRIPADSGGQVHRVGRRFGLIAAVGEVASELGIFPWDQGVATQGVWQCFEAWMTDRGPAANQEEDQAIEQVRRFLQQHGDSRFSPWEESGFFSSTQRTANRAGFRRSTEDGRTEYYVLPEVYKREICAGLTPLEVTRALKSRGFLVLGTNESSTRQERLPTLGSVRVYRIKPDILNEPEG